MAGGLFRGAMKKIINLVNKLIDLYRVKRDPVAYARSIGVKIGDDARLISVVPGMGTFGSEPYLIELGNHVTVAGDVRFVNHDGGVWVFREQDPSIDVIAPIKVGNNVFIGYGSLILPGVVIGDNVVIGAKSVVTGNIPSNSIAAGIPARVIKSLDDYRQGVDERKDSIRHYSDTEKRNYLIKKFGIKR